MSQQPVSDKNSKPDLSSLNFQSSEQTFLKAQEIIQQRKEGLIVPFKTQWNKFNKIIGGGLVPATTYIIGGRPGVGKSAFSNRMLFSVVDYIVSKQLPVIVLYWTWEMPSYQQIIRQLSYELGKTVQELMSSQQLLDDITFDNVSAFKHVFANYPIYFNSQSTTPENIYKSNQYVINHYPQYQIINILDHTRLITSNNKSTEEERITHLLSTLASLATSYNVINIVLSQLNRAIESEQRLRNPIPYLSDFFGADAVGQFGNVCMILQRPEMYGLTQYGPSGEKEPCANLLACHILKNRDGPVGWIPFEHQLPINRITER